MSQEWKLVPVVATEEMIHAIALGVHRDIPTAEIWPEILACAPVPPAGLETWPKIGRPAKVGGTRFGVGVSAQSVIDCAYRLYEYEVTPEKEAERIKRANDTRAGLIASALDVPRLQAENAALQQHLNLADQRVDELEDAATVAAMRIRELDLTFGRYLLGMKSAVIADESGGNGMEWIFNGLAGPGELPPEDEIDAQAYFDREVEAIDVGLAEVFAFHDARRKAIQVKQ